MRQVRGGAKNEAAAGRFNLETEACMSRRVTSGASSSSIAATGRNGHFLSQGGFGCQPKEARYRYRVIEVSKVVAQAQVQAKRIAAGAGYFRFGIRTLHYLQMGL